MTWPVRALVGILVSGHAVLAWQATRADCAPCHRTETGKFVAGGMTRALVTAEDSPILRDHPTLTVAIGRYNYEIAGGILSVTSENETVRVPLAYAFGQGAAGQTFLFLRDGQWHESRVSYFSFLQGLDLTMGAQNVTPHTLLEAAGRALGPAEAAQCFACHATNVGKSPAAGLPGMIVGVQCERCHGASEAHLRNHSAMRKLGALTTEEMSDFCGQCHRTWSQIAADGPRGIQNVRFQPYRLALSKCYDAEDRRIRCTACHDPHRALETAAAAYDAKCRACHSPAAKPVSKASAHICRVASRDCVTCHMPALDLPGAHKKFTDHRIRIARAGEPYPD